MKTKRIILILVATAVVFAAGYGIGRLGRSTHADVAGGDAVTGASLWTCSMHPQIQLPKPGKCPICAMDLIPVSSGGGRGLVGGRRIELSPEAIKLAQIQVTPVERRFLTATVRLVGKVEYDETRLASITARVPGRLDRLFVDYTGVPVKQGDHLVELYSPELLTAQEELIQARKTARELEGSSISLLKERAGQTIESAREKLRLWGLTPEQVREIEQSGRTSDHLTVHAPVSGIVIHKEAVEGNYVNTGSRIYTIADLSQVWVKLDAYESDLPWIHYGQEVEFHAEAFPGETFRGRIAFIDPILNPKTRTVKVRVNVPNPAGRLKPEMFVRAVVHAQVAGEGKLIDSSLAGKWISPMHPEIVKDGPGQCDVCGMALVRAEDLGFLPAGAGTNEAPLAIPATAPLITGRRAVVYVALTNQPGLFEGREVVLGARAGDAYIVREGLEEGELVVVNGNFKIDSAIQLLAGPSMMNPNGAGPAPGHDHGQERPGAPVHRHAGVPEAFRSQLKNVVEAYAVLHNALAHDDLALATNAVAGVLVSVRAADMTLLSGDVHVDWMRQAEMLQRALETIQSAPDFKAARASFETVSETLIASLKSFGLAVNEEVHVVSCSMAFGSRAGRWLQTDSAVRNPYLGQRMFSCGEVVETLGQGAPRAEGQGAQP